MKLKFSKLDKTQIIKVLKAIAYVSVSSVIAGLLTWVQDNPNAFGAYTVIVNATLVTLKQLVTDPEEKPGA